MNSIDSYQLGNLLTQRIPFRILFLSTAAQDKLFAKLGPMERMHAKQWGLVVEGTAAAAVEQRAQQLLQEVQTPFEFPVVIVDENDSTARALQVKLESAKYSNALFLQGGAGGFSL